MLCFITQFLNLLIRLFSYFCKKLGDVRTVFCTHLKKFHSVRGCQFSSRFDLNFACLNEIAFVSNKEDGYFRTWVLVNLLYPVLNVVKGGCLIDCIGEDYYKCPSIEGGWKVFEFLLSCSIPNLKFDFEVFDLKRFDLKVNTDSWGVCGFETVVAVAEENVGLPDSAIAYDNCLHYEIAIGLFLRLHNYINYQTIGSF